MQVVDTVAALEALGDTPGCAFARDLQDPVVEAAVRSWDIQGPRTDELARRPFAHLTGGRLELVLLLPDHGAQHLTVRIHAAAAGVLVMGAPEALEAVRAEAGAADGVREAVVGMLLAVARRGEEVLDGFEDESERFEDRADGYAASAQRRLLGRRRAELFRIQEAQAAMHRLCLPEEQLSQELPKELRHRLRRAAVEFEANGSAAARLHTVLGDLLAEQGAVVNERLTLVATIFLPLTLATGFFGMNFGWLQERTGSIEAFVLLGLVLPAIATVLTIVIVRRLTRSS